jgi:hypothetical protein
MVLFRLYRPVHAVRDLLGVGLRFPDQRLEPLLQIPGRGVVETVIDCRHRLVSRLLACQCRDHRTGSP